MPSLTTSLLQLIDMATGENENTWGDINDANLLKLEAAIANAGALTSTGGTTTLTNDQARNAMLVFSGSLASDHTVVVPPRTKMWLVHNNHTLNAHALEFKTASGSAVTIPQDAGSVSIVFCDGTDIFVSGLSEALVDGKISAAISALSSVYSPLGTLEASSGTRMLFQQSTAPTGWTKDTTHNNKALRIVSGTASIGGSMDFTSAFTSRTVPLPVHTHGITDPGHTHTYDLAGVNAGSSYANADRASVSLTRTTNSHQTGITIDNAGTGNTLDFSVAYVDCIICTKD